MPMVLDVDGSQWIRMDYDMTGWMMRPTLEHARLASISM